MSYRNKTYVAFASEDIHLYRMMEVWRDNDNIDFSFYDSHDLYVARDTSSREQIKRRLYERISNTAKQVVLIGTADARRKGGDGDSFLAYEVATVIKLGLPVVIANKGGSRSIERSLIPQPFLDADYYTLSTSFQPYTIKFALDNYAEKFASSDKSGPHFYGDDVYARNGL
ncbi:TIR domain-containing protein [Amycolatopsis rifamycinica]|uniref:Molecular chaperone Tir n=1 Tax=Amycolatopsis rifamycinica TaxID=287986 RepID=A0A066UGM7_9PSEU|nr:TIR domain-containing protein [Amycolatopsis rifamycinica]KDN23314.1 molecular chaperone Tir [Amycolatopsis rifamycinica]